MSGSRTRRVRDVTLPGLTGIHSSSLARDDSSLDDYIGEDKVVTDSYGNATADKFNELVQRYWLVISSSNVYTCYKWATRHLKVREIPVFLLK